MVATIQLPQSALGVAVVLGGAFGVAP